MITKNCSVLKTEVPVVVQATHYRATDRRTQPIAPASTRALADRARALTSPPGRARVYESLLKCGSQLKVSTRWSFTFRLVMPFRHGPGSIAVLYNANVSQSRLLRRQWPVSQPSANPQFAAAERISSNRSALSTTDALLGTYRRSNSQRRPRCFQFRHVFFYVNGQARAVPSFLRSQQLPRRRIA